MIQSTSSSTQLSSYIYKTLVDSKVDGTVNSIEFSRPKEFSLSTKDSSLVKGEYVHTDTNASKQLAVVGGITAYTFHPIIADNPPVDIGAAKKAFNDQKNSDYQTYLKSLGINDFLSSELTHRYFGDIPATQVKLAIQRPTVLTTSNLKADTWLISFSAQSNSNSNQTVKGDLVFAIGNSTSVYNAFNFVTISTLDYNWQPNQAIWQQVIDSVKITDNKKS